jgi:long-subunit fatty acid transport protein
MKSAFAIAVFLAASATASAQDQQLGARTKAMGGSYTAFEDDPVSIWLNPAGIAGQLNALSIAYQTYAVYPIHHKLGGSGVEVSGEAKTTFVDPAFVPSYLGLVFQLGTAEAPMAVGVCFARPFHLNYTWDHVQDPSQTQFVADTNITESFNRFRIAFASDFRIVEPGEAGFLTHVAVGAGLDLGYSHWSLDSDTDHLKDDVTAPGGGVGVLVGVYDNTDDLKINFGVAWQSMIAWDFSNDPRLFPAFDMPQQVNVGMTGYFLKGFPLRATLDFQWVNWKDTVDEPSFPGRKSFRNALNYSVGVEYKFRVSDSTSVYPRLGYRRFAAPWSDKNNLPMADNYQLLLDTKAGNFNLVTFGTGLSWTSGEGKIRSIDVAGDVGGDTFNVAFGFNYEF